MITIPAFDPKAFNKVLWREMIATMLAASFSLLPTCPKAPLICSLSDPLSPSLIIWGWLAVNSLNQTVLTWIIPSPVYYIY